MSAEIADVPGGERGALASDPAETRPASETPARPKYPLGPGGAPPVPEILTYGPAAAAAAVDPYAIQAYRDARAAIGHEPPRYEPPRPRPLELARQSYYDAVDLARSIDRLSLEDRSRILQLIAAIWPETVAAAIEDIATRPAYTSYAAETLAALELVP